MRFKIGQTSVSLERGDISDWDVDAIVNPASSNLTMTTGIAGSLKRKGGPIIEEEAMRQGPIEIGEAVLATAGNLLATHVIHAATMGPDLKTDPTKIGDATRSALRLADKHRLSSVALPALGTGAGGVAPSAAAQAMVGVLVDHLRTASTALKRVVLVVYQDDAYRAFTETLNRMPGLK
jgi:O-acetyl-ADP-ribose deacetylase (regulator of RNase III)